MCWALPLIPLVSRVLCHAQACSATGTLIVPLWKSATFWPKICPDGHHLAPFVHAWYVFPFYKGLFQASLCGGNLGDANSKILAILFDFTSHVRLL